jgi:hypothetical protein
MSVVKESEGTAIWAKLGVAFVAGLVLAAAGAMIVVRNLAPKTVPAAQEVASAPVSAARPTLEPAEDTAVEKPAPHEAPPAAAETSNAPAPRKKHPSAFGGPKTARRVLVAQNTSPAPTEADQSSQNGSQSRAQQSTAQTTVAQQQPPYAPVPDLAPVGPQAVQPADRPAQPEVRQDNPAPNPARQPQTVTIDAGTSLMVRIGETISTKTKVVGDSFRGTLDQPIIMNGFVIADKGSKVAGRVVSAQKGGHLTGSSDLSLQVTEIHTTDGQTVHIETSPWEKKGESNTAGNVTKIGGGAALGAIIGAIAGGGKGAAIGAGAGGAAGTGVAAASGGKPTVVPVETVIAFRLNGPVTITEQINN